MFELVLVNGVWTVQYVRFPRNQFVTYFYSREKAQLEADRKNKKSTEKMFCNDCGAILSKQEIV
jgi:hypothetical protein